MQDARLLIILMRYPCMRENLQAVLKLQQTSREVQTAVAEVLQGQVSAVFNTVQHQQLQRLKSWLAKHAGLLKGLTLQIDPNNSSGYSFSGVFLGLGFGPDGFLGTAMQHAVGSLLTPAAGSNVALQALTLRGTTASARLLQQLPAAHLTELCAEVDLNCSDSMKAVAALSRLQRLTLVGPTRAISVHGAARADDALAPLAAGLQQLTQLHISPVRPAQLLQLPPKLQQLHITTSRNTAQKLLQLAGWVERHGSVLSSLDIGCFPRTDEMGEEAWTAALSALVAAFTSAAVAPTTPPPPAAAATTAAQPPLAAAAAAVPLREGTGWQLASLSAPGLFRTASVAPLLRTLPVGSLTHLVCSLHWASVADIGALCGLTALRSLELWEAIIALPGDGAGIDHILECQGDQALAPLSVLQQLTDLQLHCVRGVQLQHLQLPRLQQLKVALERQSRTPLLLGHMASVTALAVGHHICLLGTDQLPPNLRTLTVSLNRTDIGRPCCMALQPLLSRICSSAADLLPSKLRKLKVALRRFVEEPSCMGLQLSTLSQLQSLQLGSMYSGRDGPAAHELARLSTLRSLQEVRFVWNSCGQEAAAVKAMVRVFQVLPLKALSWTHTGIPAGVVQQMCNLQGLTALQLRSRHDAGFPYHCGDQLDKVTPAQLAVVLQQLTALQRLHLSDEAPSHLRYVEDADADYLCNGVVELVRAVDGLQHSSAVRVEMYVGLHHAAVQRLNDTMLQLLSGSLAQGCTAKVVCSHHKHPLLHIYAD